MDAKLVISPQTKIGELLDNYPQLEKILVELSPTFAKLKNPILRKTVAKVATLQQAAVIGGLKVDELVNRLRNEVGQDTSEIMENSEYLSDHLPEWVHEPRITIRVDATPIINSGGSPMNDIISKSKLLKTGEILELKTPFLPAPILDMLKKNGFSVCSVKNGEVVISYVGRL